MVEFAVPAGMMRLLELNEGLKLKPYVDTVGKVTIGLGRNLTDRGITRAEAFMMARTNVEEEIQNLLLSDSYITLMDPVRQAAVIDLAYNLGISKWRQFRRTRDHLAAGEYELAAEDLMDSKWFRQVGLRGPRIVKMIVTGLWPWDV